MLKNGIRRSWPREIRAPYTTRYTTGSMSGFIGAVAARGKQTVFVLETPWLYSTIHHSGVLDREHAVLRKTLISCVGCTSIFQAAVTTLRGVPRRLPYLHRSKSTT